CMPYTADNVDAFIGLKFMPTDDTLVETVEDLEEAEYDSMAEGPTLIKYYE
ncbi:hypothetical protein KIPB_017368, partial [Kipferlia bialata]